MAVVSQERILNVIQNTGPLLPARLAKEIGTDILIASAHLSYLVDNKKVKLSSLKVGGSPVYYTENQKSKLQDFTDNLNEKDQKTFNLLKEKKILRDDKQDQLTRVSLRTLKDFAVPLQVTQTSSKILFWKWYMLSNEEAEGLIRRELSPTEDQISSHEQQLSEKANIQGSQKEKEPSSLPEEADPEERSALEEEKKRMEEEKAKFEEERRKAEEEKRQTEEEKQKREEEAAEKEKQEKEQDIKKEQDQKEKESGLEEERKKLEEERKIIEEERKKIQEQLEKEREAMRNELEKEKKGLSRPEEEKQKKEEQDPFYKQLMDYFGQKEIKVVEFNIVRKNSEIDMILKIPSVVGELDYYCKAKNKKTISDSDLSSAVVHGQLKKLPVLYLSSGKLTKKAEELLTTELKKSIAIKKI